MAQGEKAFHSEFCLEQLIVLSSERGNGIKYRRSDGSLK